MNTQLKPVEKLALLLVCSMLWLGGDCDGTSNANNNVNNNGGVGQLGVNENDNGQGTTDGVTVTQADVIAILEKWKNLLLPTLPSAEVQAVEDYVAEFPLTEPDGKDPIEVIASADAEPVMTHVVNRRDWAYALQGADYTLRGGFFEDQADLLDVGMWCFVEAALLVTDEPEHLNNVAFHLNERDEYEDAQVVGDYALSVDDNVAALYNNLAFSASGQNDYETALTRQLQAVSLQPDAPLYIESLTLYATNAGADATAALAQAMLDGSALPDISAPAPPTNLSLEAVDVYLQLLDLWIDGFTEATTYADPALRAAEEVLEQEYTFQVQLDENQCILAITNEQRQEDPLVECRLCWFQAAARRWNLSLAIYQLEQNYAYSYIAHMQRVRNDYFTQGLTLIDDAGLDSTEAQALSNDWELRTLESINTVAQGVLTDLENFRLFRVEQDRESMNALPCVGGEIAVIQEQDPICQGFIGNYLFCTHWSVQLFFVGFEFDPQNETIELSLGPGVQGKFEYNFKTSSARIGIGVQVNLDNIIRAGAALRYGPSSGLEGTTDLKAGVPSVLPTPEAPPIAKMVLFTNH